jgi:hypothetical protein
MAREPAGPAVHENQLVILKTANALGLAPPPNQRDSADEVIEGIRLGRTRCERISPISERRLAEIRPCSSKHTAAIVGRRLVKIAAILGVLRCCGYRQECGAYDMQSARLASATTFGGPDAVVPANGLIDSPCRVAMTLRLQR